MWQRENWTNKSEWINGIVDYKHPCVGSQPIRDHKVTSWSLVRQSSCSFTTSFNGLPSTVTPRLSKPKWLRAPQTTGKPPSVSVKMRCMEYLRLSWLHRNCRPFLTDLRKHNTADPSPESKWTHAYSTMRLYVSIRRSAEEIINCINGSDYIYLLNIIWHVNLTHVICKSEVVSPKHHGTSEHLRIRSWWGCGTSNHLAAAIWGIGEQEDPHNCNSSNSNYVCIYIYVHIHAGWGPQDS